MSWYEDHIFPVALDWATRPLAPQRRDIIAQASGHVLELGVGTGANLPFYTDTATTIHGIEPCAAMLEQAREKAQQTASPGRFHLRQAGAESLPYDDNSFDTVVACLVFCTIPDASGAAREAFRVLKPGGKLLVLEHVASQKAFTSTLQNMLNPAWRHVACGCNLNRDTLHLFHQSGFDTAQLKRWQHPKMPALAGELIQGVALRP